MFDGIVLLGQALARFSDVVLIAYALGATLRDINLPITRVDAFATAGGEYVNRFGVYAEGGVRGPLLGPAGWRAYVRSGTASGFGAGVGVELRF